VERYVAIGDSTTEGLEDPSPDGSGHLGFADRLAIRLAREYPDLQYANLAVRGRMVRQIRDEQLGPALALAPDLVTVVGGLNDILRPRMEPQAVIEDFGAIVAGFRGTGATVLGMTFPDPSRIMPAARLVRSRVIAFNEALRTIATQQQMVLVDLEELGVVDRRLWSPDRLHANAAGHRRIAAAMTQALGLEADEDPWAPLPAADPARRIQSIWGETRWIARHMTPWVLRRVRGRSSGDGRTAKRPQLTSVLG